MGNYCFKSNRVIAQDESDDLLPSTEAKKVVEVKPPTGSAMAKPKTAEERSGGGAGKKVVRFKLQEEEEEEKNTGGSGGDPGSGVLRIKVVMSQKELKQILKDRESSSCTLEELLAELKVRGRRTTVEDGDGNGNGSWRPALECIPEGLH